MMRLGLIADTHHYRDEHGAICTRTPVARQLDMWADWFPYLTACAPLLPGVPPVTHTRYLRIKAEVAPLRLGGGERLNDKLALVPRVIGWMPRIAAVIRNVDGVHLRCPCNIGLAGIAAVMGSRTPRQAVYTGPWQDFEGESPFWRLQKRLLGSRRFGGPVFVYGSWPNQPDHVITSFAPSFSDAEWNAEGPLVEQRVARLQAEQSGPLRALCVGRLDGNKGQHTVIESLSILRHNGIEVHLTLAGEGTARAGLEQSCRNLGLFDAVHFTGHLSYSDVCDEYRRADVIVLASRVESFGKVLTEGMLHGAVPVAAEVGVTPQLVGNGTRGLNFRWNDPTDLAQCLARLAVDRKQLAPMVLAGRTFSKGMTLESYWDLIRGHLERWWTSLPLPGTAGVGRQAR